MVDGRVGGTSPGLEDTLTRLEKEARDITVDLAPDNVPVPASQPVTIG